MEKRDDDRYMINWHGTQFYGKTKEEALTKMEQYIRYIKSGSFLTQSVSEYGDSKNAKTEKGTLEKAEG